MFNGNARFQNVFFEDLESKFQYAAFPEIGYFSSRATVFSLGILYRNEPNLTDISYEYFPKYAQQRGENFGFSTSFRLFLYSGPTNKRFFWFLQASHLFNFQHRNFRAQTNRSYDKSAFLFSAGFDYFLTENVAFEFIGNVDVFGGRSFFPTFRLQYFANKKDKISQKFNAKDEFVRKGMWSVGLDGGLGLAVLFRNTIPTFIKPNVSIFISERTRFVGQFSFFRLVEENPDRKRIFARYKPGLEWFMPFSENTFFTPRFHILYGSQKRDNQSRITKANHLSSGIALGITQFFPTVSIFLGMEAGVWRNFNQNNGTNFDGKLETRFFILNNVTFDVKANFNFKDPVVGLEELFYNFPVRKATSFEFGFSFYR
jgi:hypothetical protein